MRNIYITWHYTTHGVAYFKHVLSRFYELGAIPAPLIQETRLDQVALNSSFDKPKKECFRFDKLFYLRAPQSSFDKLASRSIDFSHQILEDDFVQKHGLTDIFKQLLEQSNLCYNIQKELDFVKNKEPQKEGLFRQAVWRNIHHYPVKEQLWWLQNESNFPQVYNNKELEVVELDIQDLRNEQEISEKVYAWLRKRFAKTDGLRPIINVSLGSNETQVVWHVLAEANLLPPNSRFIKTYDDKSDRRNKRFKPFSIQEISSDLLSSLQASFPVFSHAESPKRQLVNLKMKYFLKSGFSILLLGERGTGKSFIASKAKAELYKQEKKNGYKLVEANCASFEEDSKAEAELFGYGKGSFTGAENAKQGLLKEADGGILFLDEVHHLSKRVQAKLMKAIQTDENNKMSIRPMGASGEEKIECRLIFASNVSIENLREKLLPDFYDRIVQHVLHIPSLRETPEDRLEDWKTVWKNLRFSGALHAPEEAKLINWLQKLPLHGNFRDLQKIAVYYHAFQCFDEELKASLPHKTPLDYAKEEFEKYHLQSAQPTAQYPECFFNKQQTTKALIETYKRELGQWAIQNFGSRKAAVEHFKALGDTVTEKTLDNWKKGSK